jgi:glycosyltransferase involved in cell wall biosynthesis
MTSHKFPEILFISHDAFRGGATLFLLNVQRWLREHTNLTFTTIVCKPGEMLPVFSELGPVICLDSTHDYKEKLKRLLTKWHSRKVENRIHLNELKEYVQAICQPCLIYSNTVVNGRVLEALKELGIPVLTHVHEMEYSIRKYAGTDFEKVLFYTDRYIAVSKSVRDNLVKRHNVPTDKIDLIYGFVSTARQPSGTPADLKQMITSELGIPVKALIIGCCGIADWRKGSDLLAQVAYAMPSNYQGQPIHFVWVGTLPSEEIRYSLQHDAECCGVSERVHFIGVRNNPLDYIATFDIFALLSREDPFPLVVMEAAALKVPTVCFEKAGGTAEFIEHDAGIVVPYLDCKAFADACLELLSNPYQRTTMAAKAMERVRLHHDIDVIVPQILQCASRMTGTTFQIDSRTTAKPVSEEDLK